MATLSPKREGVPLLRGLPAPRRGKVRDVYSLPKDRLLLRATNGVSIFDHVLNALVPMKGAILNAMNHFWTKKFEGFGIKTHFVAVGEEMSIYGVPLQSVGDPETMAQCMVADEKVMAPAEFVVRGCLTGSGLKDYQKNGTVCGLPLPGGYQDGDELPYAMPTPTTKAETGHDLNLPSLEAQAKFRFQTTLSVQLFEIAAYYCERRGIKLADTKVEIAWDGTVCDELFTPDSSRFWPLAEWEAGRNLPERKAPTALDKQFVRAWGIENEVNKRDPEKPEDIAFVHGLEVPEVVISQTARIYRYIFWKITGHPIESYLREAMGIGYPLPPPRRLALVCGSESDLPKVRAVIDNFGGNAEIALHVISCHRNPQETANFAKDGCGGADAVIACGSKAFQLPAVLDAFIRACGFDIPVFGVALGQPGSEELLAAKLSISQVPGAPVCMNERTGQPFEGPAGLREALEQAIYGELPPPKIIARKPAKMNIG